MLSCQNQNSCECGSFFVACFGGNAMQYYGTKLTENISKREPEGYLLCLNVPVARTGTQEYLPEELGLTGSDPVPVFRSETEVFAPETLASFEGMPVTNDHPPDGVDIENIRRLQMGHAHNVRRGTGEESDLLLADLIITDPRLIDAILEGKREISCGYTYELAEEDGQYYQRKIRGNHIAVVDAGRAGPRVSIKDNNSIKDEKPGKPVERSTSMKKPLCKILARMAKDGDVEAVAEFIEEFIGEEPETPAEAVAEAVAEVAEVAEKVTEAAAEESVVVEVPENHVVTIDEESLAGVLQRLDQLIALLTPSAPAADEEPAEEIAEAVEEVLEAVQAEEEEPIPAEEEVAQLVETILGSEVSTTLEEGEQEDTCGDPDDPENVAGDALRAALLAVRPALEQMTPGARKRVNQAIAARLPRTSPNGKDRNYSAATARPSNYEALGKRIMEKRNPHFQQ